MIAEVETARTCYASILLQHRRRDGPIWVEAAQRARPSFVWFQTRVRIWIRLVYPGSLPFLLHNSHRGSSPVASLSSSPAKDPVLQPLGGQAHRLNCLQRRMLRAMLLQLQQCDLTSTKQLHISPCVSPAPLSAAAAGFLVDLAMRLNPSTYAFYPA